MPIDAMPEFIPFDCEEGKHLLAEMAEQGIAIESVPHDSELGQHYLKEQQKATFGEEAA